MTLGTAAAPPPPPIPIANRQTPPSAAPLTGLATERFGESLGAAADTVSAAAPRAEPLDGSGAALIEDSLLDAADSEAKSPAKEKSLAERLADLEKAFKKSSDEDKKKKDADALKPTIKWTGELQNDYAFFGQTTYNRAQVGDINDGADFRRVRLGAYGDIWKTIEYRIEVDFALPGRPSFLDIWVTFNEIPYLGKIRAGRFFEPFSLERLTSNRFLTFMERALPDVYTPKRNVGVMAFNNWGYDERGTWAAGMFRTGTDDYGGDVGDRAGWSGTGRVTYLLAYDDATEGKYLWHVGGGYSYRSLTNRQIRFAERPEIRMSRFGGGDIPPFVDTGFVQANLYQLLNAEMAIVLGRFSVQSEYTYVPLGRSGDLPVQSFDGAYAYMSYFLTPDHRVYRRGIDILRRFDAVFDRLTPSTNVIKDPSAPGNPRGIGAWEIAARWSSLNLSSRPVDGGRLDDVTIGVNWYLNPYTRMDLNYIRPVLTKVTTGSSNADIVGMRLQFEF